MAGNSVVKMGRLRKRFVVLVYALALFPPCSCYDETHLLFLEQQSHEREAAQKRKERRNKKYPQDKQALHGPLDKSTNFRSVELCMRMKCGMVAQLPEWSSVMRRNSGCTRFHSLMVKQH